MSIWQRLGLSRSGMGRAGVAVADVLPVRVGVPEYPRKDAPSMSRPDFDQALVWVVVALLAFGLVMVY